LPGHWEQLLAIAGTHDAAHGVLGAVRRELRLIAEHREIARGELRTALMSVEARWAVYAAWLCEDTGDRRGRTALLERALCALRAAHAHTGDVHANKRMRAQTYTLAAQDSAPPPPSASIPHAEHVVRSWEARCRAVLSPARGVALLDDLLRDSPRRRTRAEGPKPSRSPARQDHASPPAS
jgi:hypothetical protein